MESTLNLSKIFALFGAMAVLAALPSVSVLAVTAKSASMGFLHGVFTAIGIAIGDIIFILFAVFGLVLLVKTLGSAFFLIKYACGAYLIWLGVSLWHSRSEQIQHKEDSGFSFSSLLGSFITGLLITLGDQKAVLFYMGFLPAFLDLTKLTYIDIGLLIFVTLCAVGGVKIGYAYVADRASIFLGGRTVGAMNIVAACIMVIAGIFIIARS
ncbi:MAG: LysE family translocator [Pseudanabaena sp. RU_4_16]|nr:LysE family translocator [Pseudanabaena sp. SU_2_4]NJM28046.1 LysE family translocator [Pseudanabaena sp. RU_4_16]